MSDFEHFVGTQAVANHHAFDITALSVWLTMNLPGFEGPLVVESFKGGQSNPTYKLLTPGRSYVMRAKPGGQTPAVSPRHRTRVCRYARVGRNRGPGSPNALPLRR